MTAKTAISNSKEDYLKAILEAEAEGLSVIPSTLAHWLGVSAPAVTMALKRLKRDAYVEVKKDGIIRLTAKGREAAYRTALRHHLIERMLSEVFDMAWYEIHDEAERLEHAVSEAFEAKLVEKLGRDGVCPHGNAVLPESPSQRRKRGLVPLSEAAEGASYLVTSLYERDPKLLKFLHQLGIGPASPVRVLARNYDETLRLKTSAGEATLGSVAAARVWVRPAPKR
ncbi:metal-dependent transcriptional regulator [Acidipila rosea]|uniref:Transcriptional regulator MntR n=1 Tax=Acidipila rosea TaxID=768535 RepID=A0A4R1LAG6_9BACT|nr:metal-dependent transcriptional regulator [Acidipila rosea]MBW4027183.1 metal-dependent transcriptional regulator [Acidobacteriota bacterium]MBW4045760.1 metal-dependent transcriptional regulator [Acidobacteriota bacterium]TCK74310.1 DtxR family iron (metal) dependent repressor [Acidipila rosea]